MCDSCFNIFKTLSPIELDCRIRGCKNKWTYSTYEQLEQIVKAKAEAIKNGAAPDAEIPVPEPPSRMCRECFSFYSSAADIEVPCRNRSCKNKWLYTKSMQLAQKQHGRTQAPSRYCEDCAKKLAELQDKEMPCMQKGCDGTWLYLKEDQLRDLTAGREPQPHKCRRCNDFLKSHPAEDLTCTKCGCSFLVSTMQQLECELGISTKPYLCADCAREKMAEELSGEDAQSSISRPLVHIPKAGPWNENQEIRNAPASVTMKKIERMCKAAARIVCLGDEATCSCKDESKSWPKLLEDSLSGKYSMDVCVLNAGMPKCTTAMAIKRFGRDVAPFKPQVVIFSCAFADAMSLPAGGIPDEDMAAFLNAIAEDVKALCASIREIGAKPLCWMPNPIYTVESEDGKLDPENAKKRLALFDAVVRQLRKVCESEKIAATVDAHALFTAFGEQNAHKWMADWSMHNEIGASNIANWIKDEINKNSMLDGAEPLAAPAPGPEAAPAAEAQEADSADSDEAAPAAAESVAEAAPAGESPAPSEGEDAPHA